LTKRDRGNYLALIRKFLEDALVLNGIIEDDNDNYIGPVSDDRLTYDKGVNQAEVFIKLKRINTLDFTA
jgi:hypothetical protein